MNEHPLILAFESSCDDTSVAVVRGNEVLCNLISSQAIHAKWGGVIPELASRAHLENISALTLEALRQSDVTFEQLDAVACTTQPGLMGALLVGANYAKGIALRYALPCVPVHHIEGHLYSAYLEDSSLPFPAVALVVSGGHTTLFHLESFTSYSILGSTRDDAAGEAFDKAAKLLGLGYPGGAEIDKRSRRDRKDLIRFPRALMNEPGYEFSFSGVKTAVRRHIIDNHPQGLSDEACSDICSSLQEAIVDVLVTKTMRAAAERDVRAVLIAGGVSANSRLRERFTEEAHKAAVIFAAPRISYSLDNAAMIGFLAHRKILSDGLLAYKRYDFEVSSQAYRDHRHGSRSGVKPAAVKI
ncbi:MAG: tRNA (adenosine(37)-N6)-threonylcarbamoyltransferase complex transferase subunit TsaD [Candidatus Kapaibacterium sp.]|jgi:N6-L-threonylcarbamoyladenine synthase